MKKTVLFDLDGTLLDTSDGIIYCYEKAGEICGLKSKNTPQKTVIGGPLKDGFQYLYHIESAEQIDLAIAEYRRLYAVEGIKKYSCYDGLEQSLGALQGAGINLAVATLKYQSYAEKMLHSAGLDKYFDVIFGWDGTDNCTKSTIIDRVIESKCALRDECILVGDSAYDGKGAKKSGIDFLGVSYGFGIKHGNFAENIGAVYIAHSPQCAANYILTP